MTAPLGAEVGLYVDLVAIVAIGDIIETQTGRRYGVISVRVQQRGKLAGRQHLRCVVVDPAADHKIVATQNGDGIDILEVPTTVHKIRWYVRGRGRR